MFQAESDDDEELQASELEPLLEGSAHQLPTRVSCAAHTLQLVVKDGLKGDSTTALARSIQRLNSFIAAARKSSLAMEVILPQHLVIWVFVVKAERASAQWLFHANFQ